MKIPEITKVCYIGAGTMGCANAMMAALAGYTVVLFDIAEESLAQVPVRLKDVTDYLSRIKKNEYPQDAG